MTDSELLEGIEEAKMFGDAENPDASTKGLRSIFEIPARAEIKQDLPQGR